ncbi:UNVERIFIED_CONTAM: hypothetical protein FKN15_048739 [Acipenser sinensis]
MLIPRIPQKHLLIKTLTHWISQYFCKHPVEILSDTTEKTIVHPINQVLYPFLLTYPDISSRAKYCYILLALAGLTASVFNLITFIRGCKGRKSLTKVDTFFFALSLRDLFIMLYSTSVIAHRPGYFDTTSLNCEDICAAVSKGPLNQLLSNPAQSF